VDEFPRQNRGGLGTLALPSGEDGGALISALEVVGGEEVMVISAGGKVFRVPVTDVPEQHRRSRGRPIVKLPTGDRVVEVTRASGPGGRGRTVGDDEVAESSDNEEDEREQIELLS
jgi:DNA gyrase subunit A